MNHLQNCLRDLRWSASTTFVRLPSVLVMSYRGAWGDGQNQFRRLMLRRFTPAGRAPMELMPVAASVHGMIGFNDTTEEKLVALANDIAALMISSAVAIAGRCC